MIHPIFWPLLTAAVASQATATWLADFAGSLEGHTLTGGAAPAWTTESTIALDLQTMQLRDFSTGREGPPVIICAPFAIHHATIADFAPGHSIVEALRSAGVSRAYVTEWRSATPEMRFLSIDNYLSDLNVAVDSLDPPVDLVGLCQGGWLAALYAARFPDKVRRLVLAGAPIDVRAGASKLVEVTSSIPTSAFESLIATGQGLVPGARMLEPGSPPRDDELTQLLQCPEQPVSVDLAERLAAWWQQTVILPGVYYLQTVQWLFQENRIARGEFVALGRKVSLGDIRIPVFLLAGADDELIHPLQLFAIKELIGTPAQDVVSALEPVGHLSLFLGARVLAQTWTRVGRWLTSNDGKVDVRQREAVNVS